MRARRIVMILLLSLSAAVVWALPDRAAAEVDYREGIVYGKGGDVELMLDIASPKDLSEPAPAVLVIHGGGWQGGKRQDMAPLAKQLAENGYVAATVTYRLAPKSLFPAQVEDVKCAVRYLRAHADELHLDPDRIGAIGMSAGAHLAMMLGTMDAVDGLEGDGGWPDQPSKVQAVVSFVGPVNLVGEFPDVSNQILTVFMGGKPDEKQDELRTASPITYIGEGDAPMLAYFGSKDPLIPNDQAYQLSEALSKAGVAGRVEMIVGGSHGWGNPEMERTLADSVQFFDWHLKDQEKQAE